MKKAIRTLRYYLDIDTDKALAEFLGFTENTITRAKAGHKTKLNVVLPMLAWLLENENANGLIAFMEEFKPTPPVELSD